MIHDVIDAVMAVGAILELPMDLYSIVDHFESSASERQSGHPAEFSRIFAFGDSAASDKLLAEMKDMGRSTSESTLAYKWALEQSRLQN